MSKAGRKWTAEDVQIAQRLRASGLLSDSEIGQRMGRTARAVDGVIRRADNGDGPKPPRGVSTYSSEQLAAELRRRGWVCAPTSTPRRRAEVQAPSYGGVVSL